MLQADSPSISPQLLKVVLGPLQLSGVPSLTLNLSLSCLIWIVAVYSYSVYQFIKHQCCCISKSRAVVPVERMVAWAWEASDPLLLNFCIIVILNFRERCIDYPDIALACRHLWSRVTLHPYVTPDIATNSNPFFLTGLFILMINCGIPLPSFDLAIAQFERRLC